MVTGLTPSRAGSTGTTMSPEQLAREGYVRHGTELYGFALSRLADIGAAQDAMQETLVRAWRHGHGFDPNRGSLRTWLYAILRHVIADECSARSCTPWTAADDLGRKVASDPADAVVEADRVRRALLQISVDHRAAIVEIHLRDRTYAEVASELDVPVSTLRSRVFHGLRQLRTALAVMDADAAGCSPVRDDGRPGGG